MHHGTLTYVTNCFLRVALLVKADTNENNYSHLN